MKESQKIIKLKFLVLEDDELNRRIIQAELKNVGARSIEMAKDLNEFDQLVANKDFDLAFLDVYIGNHPDGLKALKICNNKGIDAFMLSSSDDENIIESSINDNCLAYLSKSHIKENIRESIFEYLDFNSKNLETKMNEVLSEHWITADFELIENIKKILCFDWKKRPLLITGETGVGKTALIKSLHKIKYGDDCPYVEFNSGGKEADSTLTDAELFGHTSDAFSGATKSKKGKFDLANNGTLFFDEIGNISISTQEKLIKAIDEKVYTPLGSEKIKKTSASFAFATLKNLEELVDNGKMKHDFYSRISGFNLEIKPLRMRRDDIILILHGLMKKERRKFIITDEAKKLIYNYDWPYNVRELVSEFENWKIEAANNRNILTKELLAEKIQRNLKSRRNKNGRMMLTQSSINYIKRHGFSEAMARLQDELVEAIHEEPGLFKLNKVNGLQVKEKVGIPRSTFRRMVASYEERHERRY